MIEIKQLIKDFNITTKEDLVKLFLYTYEYSFTIQEIFNIPDDAIILKDTILKELSDVEDFERLWYGLYFKFTLYCNRASNTKLLDNSIQKSVRQLSIIDIDFLRKQILEINKLTYTNITGLIERPIISIRYSDSNIFIEMGKYKDDILNFIKENDSLFTQKKSDSFNILKDRSMAEYRKKEEVFLELWAINLYDGVMTEVLPKIKGELDIDLDKDNSELLSNMFEKMSESEVEELSIEELNKMIGDATGANEEQAGKLLNYMNNIDIETFIDKDIILNITNNFVEGIISQKKAQNILRSFINPINKRIIQEVFFGTDYDLEKID